ncbi:MAG: DUF3159 domain-containing protein [Patulibacter sp.]
MPNSAPDPTAEPPHPIAGVPDPDGPTPSATRSAPPPELMAAIGGPLGLAESAVPAALFVGVYTLGGEDTKLAAIVAVAVAVVLTIARLARRQSPQFAVSGLIGIGLAAFIVSRTGKAEDFFLPGLLLNLAYGGAYLISIAVRWPLIGVLVALLTQQDSSWRKDRHKMRAYDRASWVWVGLFSLRLVVQLPLYLAGALVALGTARVVMGIPLFVLGLWLTWLLIRDVTTRTIGGAEVPEAGEGPADAPVPAPLPAAPEPPATRP